MLFKIFFLLTIVFSSFARADGSSIEIYKPIEFQGKTLKGKIKASDLNDLEAQPVLIGETAKNDGLSMKKSNGEKKDVHTCREYNDAKKTGYEAGTTYDISQESFFKKSCPLITLLQKAKATSSLPTSVSLENLAGLPSTLIVNLAGSSRKTLKQVNIEKQSLGDFSKKPDFKVLKSADDELEFEFEGMKTNIQKIAHADFTNSGKDQTLIYKADYATEGSYHHYQYFILTPKKPVARSEAVGE